MTSNASFSLPAILAEHGSGTERAMLVLTCLGTCGALGLLLGRLCVKHVIPDAWRLTLALHDASVLLLEMGLASFLAFLGAALPGLCSAAGFFFLFGLMDAAAMLSLVAVALLFLQNPGKPGQLSSFRKSWLLVFVVPEKVVVFVLVVMPATPIDYFDAAPAATVACFPVRQDGEKGAAYGAILFFILWVLLGLGLVFSALCAFHLWKSNNSRIHASSPNLWQVEKIDQGRVLLRTLLAEQLATLVVCFVATVVVYARKGDGVAPQWLLLLALAVLPVTHAGVGGAQLLMWSSACCCEKKRKSKEPYQKLKKLELIRVEGPGKLRLRATWSGAGKGSTRHGLVKVYGMNQLKGWAQEIVVLGMLRKNHNPSLLQCLWTSNTNPYFETMTTLSGQIITADSRLICLELTSTGSLQDFLHALEVPLPEPCTRTILHDLAEGLACLHQQNILHRNLTSAAVYLKGSVQRLVLRATLGDFEDAQIYGYLQNGGMATTVTKKQFFLPDIRAYALVALEILGHVCQRRQSEKQPHRLIASLPGDSSSNWEGSKSGSEEDQVGRRPVGSGSSSAIHFCAPGAPDDFRERDACAAAGSVTKSRAQRRDKHHGDAVGDSYGSLPRTGLPYDGDLSREEKQEGASPSHFTEDQPKLPEITHVKEAYQFQFPNQSVFHARGGQENEYEEIPVVEEKVERGALYHAIARKREQAQTGGYVVTRSASGREIFLPASNPNSRSSMVTTDSGYVGTSIASSQHHAGSGNRAAADDDEVPEFSSAKAAHRTTSANTISSFGDDILEVLPGMADDDVDDLRRGDRTRREMMRERDDARTEQIIESYEDRVRRGGLSAAGKDWPKLKFSRIMGTTTSPDARAARTTTSTALTPRDERAQPTVSPRPKTPATAGVKRIDKARPLSASALTTAAWNTRNSFRKKKARAELSRVLTRGDSFAPTKMRERRGAGAKDIERKYASHNAAYVPDDVEGLVTIENADDVDSGVMPSEDAPRDKHSGHNTQQHENNKEATSENISSFQQKLLAHNHGHSHSQTVARQTQTKKARSQKPSSFSSEDSFTSYCQGVGKPHDTSLTSGELTSASSQADSPVRHCPGRRGDEMGQEDSTVHTAEPMVVPGMKFVDSGFDEDSVSVVSEQSREETLISAIPADACTCSCSSDVMTASDSCTCTCSQCRGSARGSHAASGWSETQSSGSWSNSNSFSSYDVQMHRRKLPSRREDHVLGPDEQYPSEVPAALKSLQQNQTHQGGISSWHQHHPPSHHSHRHHHHNHHHHYSNDAHSQSGSASSKGSSAALRRYRELTKKGVPLRVSVVDESASKDSPRQGKPVPSFSDQREGDGRGLDATLYQDLESRGFFDSTDSASSKSSPTRLSTQKKHSMSRETAGSKRLEVVQGRHVPYTRYSELLPLPLLEDVIREIPDETSGSCSGDETKVFLSRPDSDPCVKVLWPANALSGQDTSYVKDKPPLPDFSSESKVHEAELVIDKIFSRAQPLNTKGVGSFVDPILRMDESTLRELATPSANLHDRMEKEGKEDVGMALLHGTDVRHVRYIKALVEKVSLLTIHELLPADPQNFDTLKWRLQQTGSFGNIGLKLLDIISACWLQECPPTTADIVRQLTDHVTETEL